MGMKWFEQVKRALNNATNYAASSLLRDNNVKMTISGLAKYDGDNRTSSRLDVLATLRKLSGLSWHEVGEAIDQDFLPEHLREKRTKKG